MILKKYWERAGNEREERGTSWYKATRKREIHVWYIDDCV
jgi:hypothetical protein